MTSFSVRCFEGFNGGLPQSFLLEVRDPVSQVVRANVTAAQPAFQVDRLEPGASYQACVYSVNSKGKSDPIILQASTIRPAEKQLHPDKGECLVGSVPRLRMDPTISHAPISCPDSP